MAESKNQQQIGVGSAVKYTREMALRLALPRNYLQRIGTVVALSDRLEPFEGSPRVATVRWFQGAGFDEVAQVLTTNLRKV